MKNSKLEHSPSKELMEHEISDRSDRFSNQYSRILSRLSRLDIQFLIGFVNSDVIPLFSQPFIRESTEMMFRKQ
jgi:hypothetical protein